jgi:hypothetical protein
MCFSRRYRRILKPQSENVAVEGSCSEYRRRLEVVFINESKLGRGFYT